MEEKEIYEVFKKLKITKEAFPAYKDPDTFAKQIKKFPILKAEKVSYSTGTGCLKEESNA